MSRISLFVGLLAIVGMFLAAGCSPTALGTKPYGGGNASVIGDNVDVVATPMDGGKKLHVKITLTEKGNEVCEGDFTKTEESTGFPGYTNATIDFKGEFSEPFGAGCTEFLKGPRQNRWVRVSEPVIWGSTWLWVCQAENSSFCVTAQILDFDPLK